MRFDDFLRRCLRPNYLVPIEQTMSDLLPRATVARFDADVLVLADIKTRYDTYGVGIDKQIISAEEARAFEGLAPGDTDNAPVPFSPPQAIPTALPIQTSSQHGTALFGMRTQARRGSWTGDDDRLPALQDGEYDRTRGVDSPVLSRRGHVSSIPVHDSTGP
jgi:hypothetical protein